MQAQILKRALVNAAHLKLTTETIKEITLFGIRAEANYAEEFTGPTYFGRTACTASLFLETDVTYDWESKSADTKEGDIVIGTYYGTRKMTGPNTTTLKRGCIYMRQSSKLSWLKNKRRRVEVQAIW